MSTIIAALDVTAAARPVLETAIRIGELTGASVEAIHVGEGPNETLELLTDRCEVDLRVLRGRVEPELINAIEGQGVIAAVLGARGTHGGRRPVGQTARHILEFAKKPVVVVPPEAHSPRPFRRALVPLEGVAGASKVVIEGLAPIINADVELVVLHVFTDDTFPRMLNHGRGMELLGSEFIARHLPHAKSIEMRTGPVSPRVIEVSAEQEADLVVLSWSQVTSGNKARVVQEVLGSTLIPILLLPVGGPRDDEADGTDTSRTANLWAATSSRR